MRPLAFSFLFFSDVRNDVTAADKYAFMRDVTLFGDREGFTAVYLPERHFSPFGAIYPNQAVVASWLAPQTQRIRFRTAGVSLPLHHPAEVVEWWAMVDVLSGGRVDLGVGSGWNKVDFVLSPGAYANRRMITAERIEVIQRLWRGERIAFTGPDGEQMPIRCFPRPIQPELQIWLLVAQHDEAFRYAGSRGLNVFTMLYGYGLDELAAKIATYRRARGEAGLDPAAGTVSLMLHTFVHEHAEYARRIVEAPLRDYIRSTVTGHIAVASRPGRTATVTDRDEEAVVDYAFHRYYHTCGLFGTVSHCRDILRHASEAGVDEIACLVDFGASYDAVLASLPSLKTLVSQPVAV